jgi:hypothetical protein
MSNKHHLVLNRFLAEYEEPSILEGFDRMWELSPHPTGLWSRSDLAKVYHPNFTLLVTDKLVLGSL